MGVSVPGAFERVEEIVIAEFAVVEGKQHGAKVAAQGPVEGEQVGHVGQRGAAGVEGSQDGAGANRLSVVVAGDGGRKPFEGGLGGGYGGVGLARGGADRCKEFIEGSFAFVLFGGGNRMCIHGNSERKRVGDGEARPGAYRTRYSRAGQAGSGKGAATDRRPNVD